MKTIVRLGILAALILAIIAFASPVPANADHLLPMQFCASHGLGPNFLYAEGSQSALVNCLANGYMHSTRAVVIESQSAGCPLHGMGPNFAYANRSGC